MEPTRRHGKICYVELPAVDVERSAAFYAAVFGWALRRRGDGQIAFDDGAGEVSGTFVTGRPPTTEAGLLLYVMVHSVAAAAAAVVASGGEVVVPPGVHGPVTIARCRDPAGNVVGLYEEPRPPAEEP